jgi:tight adherence protein C
MSLTVALVAAILGGAVAAFAVVWVVVPGRTPGVLLQRFSEALIVDPDFSIDDPDLRRPIAERVVRPLLRVIARFGAKLTPGGQLLQVRARLIQAGVALRPETLLTLQLLGVPAGAAIGVGLVDLAGLDAPLSAIVPIGLAAIGYQIAPGIVKNMIKRRTRLLRTALPNVLDLLTISMEAGLTFEAALMRVSLSEPSLLAHEFNKVLNEIRLGKPRGEALTSMAVRNDSPELTSFVRAVVQAEPLGVSVGHVLRIQSEELRRLRRQRAEQAGHRAPVLMLLPMLGCIFPCVFIMLLGPAVITVMHSFSH